LIKTNSPITTAAERRFTEVILEFNGIHELR
jgi:hypothetical protein